LTIPLSSLSTTSWSMCW